MAPARGCPYHGRYGFAGSFVHGRGTLYGYPGDGVTRDSTKGVIRQQSP
ncbi:MAG TPA: hypothetical protein VK140_04280 [Ktedonobacteraceae bacterium]|nr:hypothetical protein [Ktedonobacteraceae bacterium]